MMMHGRNNGKKLMTVRIVKHAFEIIHLLSGEVCKIFVAVVWEYLPNWGVEEKGQMVEYMWETI